MAIKCVCVCVCECFCIKSSQQRWSAHPHRHKMLRLSSRAKTSSKTSHHKKVCIRHTHTQPMGPTDMHAHFKRCDNEEDKQRHCCCRKEKKKDRQTERRKEKIETNKQTNKDK